MSDFFAPGGGVIVFNVVALPASGGGCTNYKVHDFVTKNSTHSSMNFSQFFFCDFAVVAIAALVQRWLHM